MPEKHPLLRQPEIKVQDVLPYGFATLSLPPIFQAMMRNYLGLAPGDPLPIRLECDNVALLKELVLFDDMILLATEAVAAKELASGALVPLRMTGMPPMYAEMGVVSLAGRSLSPAARQVLAWIGEIAATMPATGMYRDGEYHYPEPGQ